MIQQHREVCLAIANKKFPSTFREDLLQIESSLRQTIAADPNPEYAILANSARSLRDGLQSRDATSKDWEAFTSSLKTALTLPTVEQSSVVDMSALSEADMKAVLNSPELQDAIRTKKTLLNYQGAIQSLPTKADGSAFKVLRLPVIPIADGFANMKMLSRPPLRAVDLDGRYFVIPNQLVVAVNTNKVLTATPMDVPVYSTEKLEVERDNVLRKKAAIAEAKAKITAMRPDTKNKLIERTLAETKRGIHSGMKAKLEAEVAAYAKVEQEKFDLKIQSMVQALEVPPERKTKKAKENWLDEAQEKIEQMEMPQFRQLIEHYRAQLSKKYKAQFTKAVAIKEADIRNAFAKPTPDMKKQLLTKALAEIESDYATQLEDALAEIKSEIAEAKRRNKETKSPGLNTANRLRSVISAMEHRLGEQLHVMDGLTKYKTSGYLYYWVASDKTLAALRAGFNGSFTASQWGFPF